MSALSTPFSLKLLFSTAWQQLKGNKAAFWKGLAVLFILSGIVAGLQFYLLSHEGWSLNKQPDNFPTLLLGGIGNLISYVVAAPVIGGLVMLSLKMARGEPWDKSEALKHTGLWATCAAVLFFQHSVTAVLALIIGLSPLKSQFSWVPETVDIVIQIFLMVNVFVLVDQKCGAWEATKRSCQMMKSHLLKGLVIFIVFGCLNFFAILFFMVGLIWTAPLTLLMLAHFYLYVSGQSVTMMSRNA